MAPAVDMQQLAGQPNTYVVCVAGLHSADVTTRQVAQRLAGSLGGRWNSNSAQHVAHADQSSTQAREALSAAAMELRSLFWVQLLNQ